MSRSFAVELDNVGKRFMRHADRRNTLKERLVRGRARNTQDFWAVRNVDIQIPKGSVYGLIGHNGSGKSTLLNVLTSSEVLVADQLFATLDPTSRRLRFPMEREAIITDTVGFIRDLPPDLIRAFRATLEELEGADVLLHVVDISDPMRHEKISAVRELLEELHIGEIPEILIYNKCDLVDKLTQRGLCQKDKAVGTSAITKEGLPELIATISQRLWQTNVLENQEDWLDYSQGKAQTEPVEI